MSNQRPLSLPCLVRFALLAFVFFNTGIVEAHKVSSVSLISYLNTDAKTYVLDVAMEVVPSEDPSLNEQISPEDAAREFARDYLVVMFDRKDQKPELEIHIEETSDKETPPELRRRQVLTKMTGAIPAGAAEFLLYLDPRCPMAVVMVVVKDNQPSRRMQVVLAGEYSRPVSVAPITEGDPFVGEKAASPADSASSPAAVSVSGKSEGSVTTPGERENTYMSGWRAYLHGSMLPWLLAVAILLLTVGLRSVFLQVAILLVAQSLAIALVAWKFASVPHWIPILLVVLVAGISLEALFHCRVGWWRLPLVAVAGILAGGVIAGTPPFHLRVASGAFGTGDLIRYLLGVESAFVLVSVLSVSVLLLLSRFEWYRRAVVQPVAVILVGCALFSTLEKFL